MNALNHFLGHWKGNVTVTQADGNNISYKTTNVFANIAGTEFIEDRAVGVDEQSGHIGIWYEQDGKYHSVYFISPGLQRIEFMYDWDDETQQMVGESSFPDGSIMKAVDTIIDDNHYTWEIVHINADGTTLLTMRGEQSRIVE